MGQRFTGSFEELQEKLLQLEDKGYWRELNQNQKQFIHANGVMNWFPTTGTINFQGRASGKEKLEKLVVACLQGEALKPEVGTGVSQSLPSEKASETAPRTEETEPDQTQQFLGHGFADSEIVIGLVGAVA